MALRLDQWRIEEIVRAVRENPDACVVYVGHEHDKRMRVSRDGRKLLLHRYIYWRITGEQLDPSVALLPGGCRTEGCLNPGHRIPSRKRSMTERRKKEYRDGR